MTINNAPVQGALDFIERFQRVFDEEAQRTHDEIEPLVLHDLEVTPGAVVLPIEWTSEKQRRAYFASNGFGHGIPYQRTGHLALAWEFTIEGNSAVIRNTDKASPFVYGSLAKTNEGAYQQVFHMNTGWQTAHYTVNFWMREFGRQLIRNMNARLGDSIGSISTSTRGYTRV